MNYNEAIEFIHSVSNFFCRPGLSRISELCRKFGNPQNKLKFVHVAGTNGKGSFCAFLSNILMQKGLKVGLYTSPYIVRFNERIMINGEPISDEALARLATTASDFCVDMADKPTEFELITAIAFEYFYESCCDVVVLECGLGGRYDATNIIPPPMLSVITGVDFDHTGFLGDTIEKIAMEKAGIIKGGSPCLFGGDNPDALNVISAEAQLQGSRLCLYENRPQNVKLDLTGAEFDFEEFENLKIDLLGAYQPHNAGLAVMAAKLLSEELDVSKENIYNGLKSTKWPARFQRLSDNPVLIFDGAHNPEGVRAAVDSIRRYFVQPVDVITGVMADKDYSLVAKEISKIARRIYCVTPNNPRALKAEQYADAFKYGPVAEHMTISDAVKNIFSGDGTPAVCLGSLYLYSDIVAEINKI